jgi:hypothetical protein
MRAIALSLVITALSVLLGMAGDLAGPPAQAHASAAAERA